MGDVVPMTLKEFVEKTLLENNIQGDADVIVDKITDIARQRQKNSMAAISSDEVAEMVINNAELSAKLAREKADKKKLEDEKTRQEKLKKELEKERKAGNGEQTALF